MHAFTPQHRYWKRSQAVARIAASQRLLLNSTSSCYGDTAALSVLGYEFDLSGSRDVIGHVTIRLAVGHFLLVVLFSQAWFPRFIHWRMWRNGWHGLKRTLNKGQDHWYQSISHNTTSCTAVNSNFCSKTHRLATIHNVSDDDKRRQTTDDGRNTVA